MNKMLDNDIVKNLLEEQSQIIILVQLPVITTAQLLLFLSVFF